MENEIEMCIKYLMALQDGRVKPDNRGQHSTVRDSKDNLDDINATKNRINELLSIKNDSKIN